MPYPMCSMTFLYFSMQIILLMYHLILQITNLLLYPIKVLIFESILQKSAFLRMSAFNFFQHIKMLYKLEIHLKMFGQCTARPSSYLVLCNFMCLPLKCTAVIST